MLKRDWIEALEREHPDVALIDIGLPVMSGYEVARKTRDNPVLDDIILVALTGYGEPHITRAREAGAETVLPKPLDWITLCALLEPRARGHGLAA